MNLGDSEYMQAIQAGISARLAGSAFTERHGFKSYRVNGGDQKRQPNEVHVSLDSWGFHGALIEMDDATGTITVTPEAGKRPFTYVGRKSK
ncbi:hypothetical protein ACWDWS_02480 [Streptomyces sp. NPDC003328]